MSIDWAPSVENVASHLPMRTVDSNGRRQNTFDDDTTPNRNEVTDLAEAAADDVLAAVDGVVPSELESQARRVASFLAACTVELTYFPEQIERGQSPYDRLKELYNEALAHLMRRAGELNGDNDASTTTTGLPSFYFPPSTNGIGYQRW